MYSRKSGALPGCFSVCPDGAGLWLRVSLADGEANGIKLHKYVSVWVWIICTSDEMKT